LGVAEEQGLVSSPWRIMFLVGALPAMLAIVVRVKLREPEQWQKARKQDVLKKQLGSYRELFKDPLLRKHAILGLLLGSSGIIGLWSVGFFTPDLIRFVQRKGVSVAVYEEKMEAAKKGGNSAESQRWVDLRDKVQKGETVPDTLKDQLAATDPIINGRLSRWSSYTSLMINFGAFFGMFGFGALSQRIGRKPTFVIALLAAFFSSIAVFWFLADFWQIFVLVPVMGFCQLSLFAGYAIYFPELFPTRLRSTGTSFCYNVGRFLAALGPLVKSALEAAFLDPTDPVRSLRYAGITMCLVFLIGLFVLPFLPETKGKPLPE
jgi:MFS family permease